MLSIPSAILEPEPISKLKSAFQRDLVVAKLKGAPMFSPAIRQSVHEHVRDGEIKPHRKPILR